MHPRRSMSWMLHGCKKNNDLHLADTWHWCVNFSYMQFSALGISYVLHLPLAKALNIKLQMLLAWKVQGSTFSACLQWMWHDVILCWMRKKDCLGNLNAIWWGNLSTVTVLFRIDTRSRFYLSSSTACCTFLWSYKNSAEEVNEARN